ncbi:RING finger protein 215-like isoform X2 [Lytechinus pictus]|uniref:RING finger protein 215-like isoform X2 n=1 Tax=Lytechinus pictus TaxID=7653 RepID=UPI0030B9EF4C
MKGLGNKAGKVMTPYPNSPVKLRHIAKVLNSSKLASWAFVLSLLLQLVSGEREAIVRVQPGGIEVRGEYSRSGPIGLNASGLIQTITGTCSEDNDSEPNEFDKRKVNKDEKISEDEEWIGIFYLPPLEESAGAQSGTGCSLLEQVKQAMLFGASALLVLALNPGLFKEIELHFTSDRPIIVITDPKDIKKFRSTVDLRKNKHSANITAKPDPTAKMKPMLAPKLTLWSTCGRSSGGSKFREWEGTVCLSHHKSSSEETLQRLAKQSLSKMSVWKYKRKRYQLSADSSESCAVCLEEFFKGQTIRMLPCHHTFHNRCVDSWLIRKRTCPLCKMDIIDERFGLGKR